LKYAALFLTKRNAMSPSIAEANETLRQAVEQRREAQAAGKPYEDWYVSPVETDSLQPVTETLPERQVDWDRLADEPYIEHLLEQQRLAGDGITHEQRPGSLPFLELLEEVRQLHYEKTASYGGAADPFENVTASAKCGVEPWRRALCDLSDCVVRMQKYANGQPVDYENALIDAANWSLICLLKLREAKRG
jgi:hypothetical protein